MSFVQLFKSNEREMKTCIEKENVKCGLTERYKKAFQVFRR